MVQHAPFYTMIIDNVSFSNPPLPFSKHCSDYSLERSTFGLCTLKGFFRGIGNGFKFTGEFIEGILWQVGDRLTLVNHKRNLHLDHQEDQCS